MKYFATLPLISLFLLAAATPLPTPDSTHDDVSSPWTKPSDKFGPGHHGRAEQHEDVSSPWTRPADKFGPGHHPERPEQHEDVSSPLTRPSDKFGPGHHSRAEEHEDVSFPWTKPSDKFGPGHHGKRSEQYQDILSSLIETAESPERPEDISPPAQRSPPSWHRELTCETLRKNDLWAELLEKYYPSRFSQPSDIPSPSSPQHPEPTNPKTIYPPFTRQELLPHINKIIEAAEARLARIPEYDIYSGTSKADRARQRQDILLAGTDVGDEQLEDADSAWDKFPDHITCAFPPPVDPWADIRAEWNDVSGSSHGDRVKQAEEQIAYWTRILTLEKSAVAEQYSGFLSLSTMKLEFIGPAHPLSSQPESTVSYVMKGTLPGSSQNSLFILTTDESVLFGNVILGSDEAKATLVRVAEGDEGELGVDARVFLRGKDKGEEWKSREVWEGLKKGVYWVMPEEKERDEGVTTSNPLAW